MRKDTQAETTNAMNAAIYELVNLGDRLGIGPQAIEHLGQDGFQTLMQGYRAHEEWLNKSK
jgi:hypothetical protein